MAYCELVVTDQIAGISANGNGDSGGPVFAISDSYQVLASGVISGIMLPSGVDGTRCEGLPYDGNRRCSPRAIFAPIWEALWNSPYRIMTR